MGQLPRQCLVPVPWARAFDVERVRREHAHQLVHLSDGGMGGGAREDAPRPHAEERHGRKAMMRKGSAAGPVHLPLGLDDFEGAW
jgi:hypothetical protein